MILLNKSNFMDEGIESGDIIVFSDTKAFLIVHTDIEYLAIQLLNNGNENLDYVDYTNPDIYKLVDTLISDYGSPLKTTNIYNAEISL